MPRLPKKGWIKTCVSCELPTACHITIIENKKTLHHCRQCSKRVHATEQTKHVFTITRQVLCASI